MGKTSWERCRRPAPRKVLYKGEPLYAEAVRAIGSPTEGVGIPGMLEAFTSSAKVFATCTRRGGRRQKKMDEISIVAPASPRTHLRTYTYKESNCLGPRTLSVGAVVLLLCTVMVLERFRHQPPNP